MKPGDLVMVRRNLPGAGGFAVVLDWDPSSDYVRILLGDQTMWVPLSFAEVLDETR
jgi:hypothetical protein